MKKVLLSSIICVMLATAAISATTVDVVTGFSGNLSGGASGKIYYPITSDTSAILGFSSTLSTTASKASDVDTILGITATPPVIGAIDIYSTWGNAKYAEGMGGGDTVSTSKSTGTGTTAAFMMTNLSVSKKWLYKLTEKIDIGLNIVLLDIKMGTNANPAKVGILTQMYPIFGATVTF